ncbi:MAG: helix-turn-helix domain-containing protein, partial [Bacteroidota bacterium]
LRGYSWPGNIRELQHMMENATIMTDASVIKSNYLKFTHDPSASASKFAYNDVTTLSKLERKAVKAALKRNQGNINRTANELGITRKTLYNKIKKYEL